MIERHKIKLDDASVFEVINRVTKLDKIPLTLQYDIVHTLKALQQENERLKDAVELYHDTAKTWEAGYEKLKQENERLQAQAGQYREVLKQAKEALKPLLKLAVLVNNEKYAKGEYEGAGVAMGWVDKAKEALAAIDKIGGVEDV